MKFLIINSDYPAFLTGLYDQTPGLAECSFEEQMKVRNASLFGVADFYSRALRKHGHEAWDVHFNNQFMQSAWAREHDVDVNVDNLLSSVKRIAARTPLRHLKTVLRPVVPASPIYDILAAQIRQYRPDVLLNQDVDEIPDSFLAEMKPHVGLLVGQIASQMWKQKTFPSYDLLISSLPHYVDYFRSQGLRSALSRLAFEKSILDRLQPGPPRVEVSFVGSLSTYHAGRVQLIESLCEQIDMALWGYGRESLPKESNIHRHHHGTAWGREMYQILKDSKITLNHHHVGVAEKYANNMRLFEATGVGTMLITDHKENLHEMFEPGREVVVYKSGPECLELIRYYLDHDREREAIARCGQQRTLKDHNYEIRTQELLELISA